MSEFHEPPPFTFKHVVFWFAVFLAALGACAWLYMAGS